MSIVLSKVAEPYAKALLDLATSTDSVEATTLDMVAISYLLSNSSDLKKFLGNPLITKKGKKTFIKEIIGCFLKDSKSKENILNFLLLLVDRSRIEVLESIAQRFKELAYEQELIKIVKITSSCDLDEDQQKKISKKLRTRTGAKKLKIACKVDRRLIAGFTIQIGSELIDASLLGEINQFSALLG